MGQARDEEAEPLQGGGDHSGSTDASPSASAPQAKAMGVCRICLEEDALSKLEQPCSCSGSMQSAHHECLQQWIDEKGDAICEICKQPFRGSWRVPPPRAPPAPPPLRPAERMALLGAGYVLTADPRTGAITARRVMDVLADAESDDEGDDSDAPPPMSPGAACLVSAALLLLVLLLLRHLFAALPRDRRPPGPGPAPEVAPGRHQADAQFEDVSATLLMIWLLMRLLLVVVPFYAVSRAVSGLRGGRPAPAAGDELQLQRRDGPGDLEMDGVVGRLLRRLEEGGGNAAGAPAAAPPAGGAAAPRATV